MPILIANVCIPNVTGGIVTFGDTYYVSPKSNTKSASGAGGGNTGIFVNTNSGVSGTNTVDPDVSDQNSTGNI
ncbi:spore germination protein [Priestia sp. 179-F W1.4 NHS]|uniref:spore germination protein n=1 Tax=Priestia sp. 179-F W1.4 NHS TaxID=3374296 RepID=UPI003879EDD0